MKTNQRPDRHKTRALISDLLGAYILRPAVLQMGLQESNGACLWVIRGDEQDDPLLIGVDGAHVRALEQLVAQFGAARGEDWTLRLVTETEPRERERNPRKIAISYEPEPIRALLERLIAELAVANYRVTVDTGTGPRDLLTFIFRVHVKDAADALDLTTAKPPNGLTTIGAISTLFRAIARKNGVDFLVALSHPSLLRPKLTCPNCGRPDYTIFFCAACWQLVPPRDRALLRAMRERRQPTAAKIESVVRKLRAQ
jgi:hypothetical protein